MCACRVLSTQFKYVRKSAGETHTNFVSNSCFNCASRTHIMTTIFAGSVVFQCRLCSITSAAVPKHILEKLLGRPNSGFENGIKHSLFQNYWSFIKTQATVIFDLDGWSVDWSSRGLRSMPYHNLVSSLRENWSSTNSQMMTVCQQSLNVLDKSFIKYNFKLTSTWYCIYQRVTVELP